MSAVVTEEFNAQQMVIAQTAGADRAGDRAHPPRAAVPARLLQASDTDARELLQKSLPRVQESGVRRVDIVERRPAGPWPAGPTAAARSAGVGGRGLRSRALSGGHRPAVWTSAVRPASSGAEILIATPSRRTPGACWCSMSTSRICSPPS